MEVDEVTIPSPDLREGHTFGPVTVESPWKGPLDPRDEVPVAFAPQFYRLLGIIWYAETHRTRGVFSVKGDQIALQPTAPTLVERAAWWRRAGYWLLTQLDRKGVVRTLRSSPSDPAGVGSPRNRQSRSES